MESKNKKKIAIVVVVTAIIIGCFILHKLSFMDKPVEPDEPVIEEPVVSACDIEVHDKIYLAVGEEYKLEGEGYTSSNNEVAKISNNKVVGVGNGSVAITNECNSYEFEVTDLITAPYISEDKDLLPCDRYSVEENEYLDEILSTKIQAAGYKTRSGPVAAGRFLLLQFPYHMKYFAENGRLPYCDGEGRYYHEGLYLNLYKVEKENITAIIHGPAQWGCRMYSVPAEKDQINSLDCSGFVTWCLVNGGFDPGDIGAGGKGLNSGYPTIGPQHEITMESLDEVKVGDLFAEDGHISILLGINDGKYYIGESNLGIDVRMRVSTKQELIDSEFYAWIDMDEFYNHLDGNINNYWE